ncbi:diaminopimelate epimerase [Pontimicrobium aquaticum]|uniref:Diaminopimelate epimerase n=1 Tax=Pontimicrobium aquaticum TaxID=2565367 RepID=A0A4V5LQN7_9FLAO|nr:diaminopimelate epimerase [Pontimicrobium aquaticum]TJY36109.1 diaminopimelate epimerase [Pontimicrobium aquaticum]
MTHTFYKYQGTGNDFVIIDNRQNVFDKNNTKLVAQLCDRRFGIGADGLILLENHDDVDFKMVYYNSDGNESTMCGNGGRCLVAFAKRIGVINNEATFLAIDGIHHAKIEDNIVKLQMQDVSNIEAFKNHVFLDTGSPHHVEIRDNINAIDIKNEGSSIRYGEPYNEEGTNVNFVEKISDSIFAVRTYERGVEDETLSCGTGVTAVGIAMYATGGTNNNLITLQTKGGDLKVAFKQEGNGFKDVWLIGPATMVYKGKIAW